MIHSNAPQSSQTPPSTEEVFALLEYVLQPVRVQLHREGRPIVFRIAPGADSWLFDPRAEGPLFRRGSLPEDSAALRLECGAQLLSRLVTDDAFVLGDDDHASFDGDLEDLLILAKVLGRARSVVGIRAAGSKQ